MPSTVELLEQELPNYLHHIKNKNSEEAKKQYSISSLFEKIFGVASEDLDFEVPTKTASKLRGRADTLFQNIIFEWKQDAKNSKAIDDGETELKKYFQHFLEKEPLQKYIGIITDGVIFKPYLPIIEKNKVTGLSLINELNISKTLPEDIFYWFDSYLYKSEKIKPTTKAIKMQFGLDSAKFGTIRNELKILFDKVRDYRDVKLKFDNWSDYLEIVYGEKHKEENLFFKHTYLSILVKLLIHLKLSSAESNRFDEILPILLGNRFTQFGVINFSEEDFFTWPMNIAIRKQSSQIFSALLLELDRFDIDAIDEDVLKDLYQELVDPEVRKLLGEFYTPDWLAEKMVIETLDDEPLKSVLDPSCGSGTFLFMIIKFKIKKLLEKGMKKPDILKHITENVFGFDVHPLAAIISKTNYLLALRDLLRERKEPITIPVFLSDSLKIPTKTMDVGYATNVLAFEALDKKFIFPEDIASDMVKMDNVIDNLKAHGASLYQTLEEIKTKNYDTSEDTVISNLLSSYETSIKNIQDSTAKEILLQNAKVLFELIRNNLDSIWPYILRNMYRPISLTYKKVDLIIGNPPWLALQFMKNSLYQNFLKSSSNDYGLVDRKKVQNITHLELATLFFCKTANMYLKDKGMIAFVMPRSVLVASQHEKFREFKKPLVKLTRIYDLEESKHVKVMPLFKIPSCVLFGIKGEQTVYPTHMDVFNGKLNSSNEQLEKAKRNLKIEKSSYTPVKLGQKERYYYKKFSQGTTIVPGSFWFVNIVNDPLLGFNPQSPFVRSEENRNAKYPWNNIKVDGIIEKQFIFTTIVSNDLVPFGYRRRKLVVLPVFIKSGVTKIVSSASEPMISQYNISKYLRKAENYWEKHATTKSKKMTIYERLNYQNGLTSQNSNSKFKVLYVSSATYMTACVINTDKNYKISVGEIDFVTTKFFADSTTYLFDTESEKEAYYLSSILNSKIIDEKIKPHQARGQFGGPRHIHKIPLTFGIPQYNKKISFHNELAELGKICHEKIPKILQNTSLKSIGKIRSTIRDELSTEYEKIDKCVKAILED